MIPTRVTERALTRRVAEIGSTGWRCLVSTYSVGNHGYAQIGWGEGGKANMTLVHLVVWKHYHGEIPAGYEVDHICRNRRCSRLAHLRLLTISENHGLNSWKAKTHCPNGHPYDDENTYRQRTGWRQCKACLRAPYRTYSKRAA